MTAFTGTNVSPYDQQSGATATQPGSLTPAGANSLFVTAASSQTITTYTVNSGFTISDQQPGAGSLAIGGGMAYVIQSGGPSALNPTWTTVDTTAMAVFKP
jgi:hypothetical protein